MRRDRWISKVQILWSEEIELYLTLVDHSKAVKRDTALGMKVEKSSLLQKLKIKLWKIIYKRQNSIQRRWNCHSKGPPWLYSRTSICTAHWIRRQAQPAHQKQPLMQNPIPNYPYQTVGADLFELEGKNFLVVTNYFNNFFEVVELNTNTTAAIVTKKMMCAVR